MMEFRVKWIASFQIIQITYQKNAWRNTDFN